MPKEMMSEVNVVRRGEALIAVQAKVMDSINARRFMRRFLGTNPNLAITFTAWQ